MGVGEMGVGKMGVGEMGVGKMGVGEMALTRPTDSSVVLRPFFFPLNGAGNKLDRQ